MSTPKERLALKLAELDFSFGADHPWLLSLAADWLDVFPEDSAAEWITVGIWAPAVAAELMAAGMTARRTDETITRMIDAYDYDDDPWGRYPEYSLSCGTLSVAEVVEHSDD